MEFKDGVMKMFTPGSNHVMVDCETMSTAGNAAVLQIGAVQFDRDGLHGAFEVNISLQESMDAGHHISASTIMWWLGQSEAARVALIDGQKSAVEIADALHQFTEFLEVGTFNDESKPKIWGNDPSADNRWLMELYSTAGMELPWKYYNNRCYRTFCAERAYMGIKRQTAGIKHSALGDAKAQAMHMVELINY